MSYTVNAYEVKGEIDYDKVISQFGVSRIDDAVKKRLEKYAPLPAMLRRNIFFAHRDLIWLLDKYDAGEKFVLYTGRAPSGPVHLGHMIPWLFTKWLQETFDVELYFQFPDEEKFLVKKNISWDESQQFLEQNMLDVIAMGFNPKKTFFVVDSKHANYLYPLGIRVSKHITFSMIRSTFGFTNEQNVGAIFYTAMQAAPAALPSVLKGKNVPVLIPHAIDQDPHFRLTRDVMPKLGYYKPASIQCRFLPGLGGLKADGKMSSSAVSTAILATDDAKTVKSKINKYAFSGGRDTVEEHRRLGGNPDIDVSFQWLTFLEEDDARLAQIHADYKSGKLLSGELKAILIEKINKMLCEHQARRMNAKALIPQFILK